jgi:uncharacterized protein YlbG (UPF0298 family)
MKIFKRFKIIGKMPSVQKLPAQKSPMPKIGEAAQKLMKEHNLRKYYGTEMDPKFYTKPPVISVAKERIEKFGNLIESRSLERISKIRQAAGKRILSRKLDYGSKANVYKPGISSRNPNIAARFPKLKSIRRTKFGKAVEQKVSTLSLQAEKLAKIKSKKAMEKFSKRLDITMSKPKDRPVSFYAKKQDVPKIIKRGEEADFQRSVDMGFAPKGYFNYQNEGNYIKWNRNQRRSIYREAAKRREQYKRKK